MDRYLTIVDFESDFGLPHAVVDTETKAIVSRSGIEHVAKVTAVGLNALAAVVEEAAA